MLEIPESLSQAILKAAIEENKASELIECLFDGGSVTIDGETGKLILISSEQLDKIFAQFSN